MAHQGRYLRIVTALKRTQCRHRGCSEAECTFRFEFPDGADAGWLCDKHAIAAGFCPRCGNFITGSGDETSSGLCRDCLSEFRAECGEDDAGGWDEIEDGQRCECCGVNLEMNPCICGPGGPRIDGVWTGGRYAT